MNQKYPNMFDVIVILVPKFLFNKYLNNETLNEYKCKSDIFKNTLDEMEKNGCCYIDCPLIIYEFIDGDHLNKNNCFYWLNTILFYLSELHNHNIVHGDMKY